MSSLKRVGAAYAAAVLAFASAAVSAYWTLGGTVLLDTVGGTIERLARERSAPAILLGIVVVLVKVAGGLLALAMVQPWGVSSSSSTEVCSSSSVGWFSPT